MQVWGWWRVLRGRLPRRVDLRRLISPEADRVDSAERSYRLLAEYMGEVVCHVGDQGRFLFVSPSVEKVLGAPADYWVGRSAEEIIPGEDLADYRDRVRRLVAGETVKERVRVRAVDGTPRWVHMLAKPFYDDDGRWDGTAATFREIDDSEVQALEAAAEARRQQAKAEERYRRVMQNTAVGMGLVSPDGRFEQVNTALCDFFGYDAATLTTKRWQDLTVPEYIEADQRKVDDVLQGRTDTYRWFKHYVHADGHPIWADLSVSCVRDAQGRVDQLITQVIDISEQVRAREEIAERDERNRVLAERLQRQSERLSRELDSAAAYMSSILPRELTGTVTVESRYLPSAQLGGDSFNYTWIDDDHLLVYLIDVSGHGIRPALLSVSLHNVLRSGSLAEEILLDPEAVLAELNQLFQMDQHDDHYFTMWYGVYQPSTRTLRYSSAGAPPALAFEHTPDKGVCITPLSTASPPVGMFAEARYPSLSYLVAPDCRVLLYSDGIYEADSGDGHPLGLPEFIRISGEVAGSAHWSLDDLIDRLRSGTPSTAFDDDCSLIQLTFD